MQHQRKNQQLSHSGLRPDGCKPDCMPPPLLRGSQKINSAQTFIFLKIEALSRCNFHFLCPVSGPNVQSYSATSQSVLEHRHHPKGNPCACWQLLTACPHPCCPLWLYSSRHALVTQSHSNVGFHACPLRLSLAPSSFPHILTRVCTSFLFMAE